MSDVSSNDENIGSSRSTSSSLSAFISTLVPVLLIAGIYFVLFLLLRRSQKRIYGPRTYLGAVPEHERSPALPSGLFNWLSAVWKIPDSFILNHQSLDGYLFIRFLKIIVILTFVGCLVTWPILFPVNATGGAGQTQLDILSYSNINKNTNKNRYYAHALVAWVYMSFVMCMVTRESIFFVNLRQAYLLSPLYASRLSSRTVLFTCVPKEYMNESKIRRIFGPQLKNVWIAADVKELAEKVEERDKIAIQLEGAEVKLIKLANEARLKALARGGMLDTEPPEVEGESGSVASCWVLPKNRPTHRLKFLIGKKVDTINWARAELGRLGPEIKESQAKYRDGREDKYSAAFFAEFYTQADAQAAYQMVTHHQPLHMSPRYIGLTPAEIVWENLRIQWWERVIRNIVTIGFVVALVIFWSIPVGVVGIISNVNYLENKVSFLHWLKDVPSVIMGVITGLLPSVMLAVLMSLLPVILRFMARLAGIPSQSWIELRVQVSYFFFQVIQVFLVTTLTSAATASVTQIIDNPASVTSLLAENIPKASNFYISYFILQGLGVSTGAILNISGLVLFRLLGTLLDSTPRKMYKRWSTLSGLGWGTVYPVWTNLAVIAITYSCIAPLVLGFATIGLFLIYFAYRYNLLFVYSTDIDTKGVAYARALQQILTGCYLGLISLIGLFSISTAIGPLVLTVIYLIFFILFHISLNSSLKPLLYYLPKTLEAEEEALLAEEGRTRPSIQNDGQTKGSASDEAPIANKAEAETPAKPNMFMKWLRPDVYTDYLTLRRLVPTFINITYTQEVERDAYYHPAISSQPPLLWIPRDAAGVSSQEVFHTSKVIPITDECASFNEKGKIFWDEEGSSGRPPIYEEKVYY